MGYRNRFLSAREIEVAELIARGFTSKEIAGRLHLSLNTVKTHLQRIFQKAEVRSRSELVAWWFERSAWREPDGRGAGLRQLAERSAGSQSRPSVARAAFAATFILVVLVALASRPAFDRAVSPNYATAAEFGRTLSENGEIASCFGRGSWSDHGEGVVCDEGLSLAQEPPVVEIVSPGTGSSVVGPSVTVEVVVTDFDLVAPTGIEATPGRGHIVYYLDSEPPFVPGQSAIPTDPAVAYAASHLTTHTFDEVTPGPHQVFTLLVHDDATPVIPPAIWSVSFSVLAPEETPMPQPSPQQEEIDLTLSMDGTVQEASPVAVLPAALPVVGVSTNTEGGAGLIGDVTTGLLAAGAVMVTVGGAVLWLIRKLRRASTE